MIIRHDLELVFIHVPKCAGKQLRWIFKQGAEPNAIEELWNYEYSTILNRYVDLAHLPLSDLRTFAQFKYLNRYKVIACIREPYMRLPSAVNEYYRQKSKQHEKMVTERKLNIEMRRDYYKRLKSKHSELDPRFIHSLPIHRFTHYGPNAKVDYLLRCESLNKDIEELAKKLKWPKALQNAIQMKSKDLETKKSSIRLTDEEIELAERIYEIDFETFGYKRCMPGRRKEKCGEAGEVKHIHDCDSVSWHWGPKAKKPFKKLKANRKA
ncbi:sulfotransferase family 2 domain-containing protein [Synechococcus sp. MU1611]|uniref:sulfotransferase family 2 domain-containing protein n=1 Tax=Synechococcus sp. MU1611 TaxID=2508345 RepID=UPI001CF8A0E7|nr:sulfotransferase family 2 domain-containing protein [Synechococcus sp. MU1611]MCB4411508.1 sulfotransferase family protein [Synechococcus sp. MU1611]